jgi:putative ABC transport system ATP-binding protein
VTLLSLHDVWKGFTTPAGTQSVLTGVDLAVDGGDVVAIAGPSGSGKTTLLAVMTGWAAPDAGTVELDGRAPEAELPWAVLALLPQSLGLLDELTIGENIALPLRLAPDVDGHEPGALMDRLGIGHLATRFPDEVSLGEQQRAALARAAVVGPKVLVADEPISHQNREWAEVMVEVIAQLAHGGTACVLATHDEIAFRGADRILDLHDGRLHPRPASA